MGQRLMLLTICRRQNGLLLSEDSETLSLIVGAVHAKSPRRYRAGLPRSKWRRDKRSWNFLLLTSFAHLILPRWIGHRKKKERATGRKVCFRLPRFVSRFVYPTFYPWVGLKHAHAVNSMQNHSMIMVELYSMRMLPEEYWTREVWNLLILFQNLQNPTRGKSNRTLPMTPKNKDLK